MNTENELTEKIRELSDLLNSSVFYKQDAWNKKKDGNWDMLWGASDNLYDTQSAIEDFKTLKTASRLSTYGLLQALVVQQDAIKHLGEALTLSPMPNIKTLQAIRDIRIEVAGHPTKVKKGKKRERGSFVDGTIIFTSLGQPLNNGILEYIVWSNKGAEHKKVALLESIDEQQQVLSKELRRIMKEIKKKEKAHKTQFKDQSLSEILMMTNYNIQKLWPFERDRIHSSILFESLCGAFERFKEGVKKRYGINNFAESVIIPGVVYTVEKIERLLPRIEKMLPMDEGVDALDLEVYVESLSNAFEELQVMAKEIDEEFAQSRK